MTPRQKVITIIGIGIVLLICINIVENYLFSHNLFGAIISFIINGGIIIWLATKISKKEEIKEYTYIHTKVFNWSARFVGVCFFIGGIIFLWPLFSILQGALQGQIVIDDTNRVTFIVSIFIPIFLIIIGYAFIRAEEYKPRDIEPPDENRSDNQHEKVDPLRQMLREQEEQKRK